MRKSHQKRRVWSGTPQQLFLFKVTLNWYGEIHIFHTHANSEPNAERNAKKKLTVKLRKKPTTPEINYYFNGKKDNVTIEKLS